MNWELSKWLLTMAIAVGVTFELVKRLPIREGTPGELISGEWLDSSKPYARPSGADDRSQSRMATRRRPSPAASRPVSQLIVPKVAEGQFDSSAPKGQAQNGEAKAREDQNQLGAKLDKKAPRQCRKKDGTFMDLESDSEAAPETPKTAAPKQAQSEAKPETETEIIEDCPEEQIAEISEEPEKKDADTAQDHHDPQHFAFAGGTPAANNGGGGDPRAGIEEWKRKLLNGANWTETVRLIEEFQGGRISSEVFYGVLELMLKSSDQQTREFAVIAAGRTPSYRSFLVLSEILKREGSSSRVRTRAESEMRFYEQVKFISVLEQVLRDSDDIYAVILATQKVDILAQRYLAQNSTGGNPPRNATTTAAFRRLVNVLQQLTTEVRDTTQVAQIRQTLDRLRTLLQLPA